MIDAKKSGNAMLLLAYAFMLMTFTTGFTCFISFFIAWKFRSIAVSQAEEKHSLWIFKSNLVLLISLVVSAALVFIIVPGLDSDSVASLVVALVGAVTSIVVFFWYFYRAIRGFSALWSNSPLP